jgi:Ser/Thr protein kinase RdoA (MazF antagonist)
VPVSDHLEIARAAIDKWDGDPASLQLVQLSQNAVYRFRQRGTLRFLRLTEDEHRPRPMVEAELEFIGHLREHRCRVAAAVPSRDRATIESFQLPTGAVHAVVFEAAVGEVAKWGDDADNRNILRERGQALGQIHRASKLFQPKHKRFHWHDDELFHHPEKFIAESDNVLGDEYNRVMSWLKDRPTTSENYGMIHGDFAGSNVVRSAGQAIAFDFDDCCYHWFSFDVAVAMWAGRALPAKYRKPYLACFLESYARENSLAGDTCREIDWFTRMVAIYRYIQGMRIGDTPQQQLAEFRQVIEKPIEWC